ncbi:ABC-type branched-subunit amino acid transport system substrate-binding protein [Variovorax boronicumulans]|uniref:ABC transporter substrate-binding protein n=1 Tax=Variovorax boronicumulans TaxID=436515 RepID=UPI0027817A49|nr:ABC transporter substrate-binding protein [Variovorax boronicumulans]MDP9995152.1 ABC-type branched-subunit amino acid transport system substrate-binding protein [Variovorax boronicumulans]MDQ0006442.1 ABC-type branched-subunit amino acid transport system substrate-binding protein [Variovorax boronicumulans]
MNDREILLGCSAALSGSLGSQIKVAHNGAGLAFDAVNEQGGVGGRRVKLMALYYELKPEKAVKNLEKLLNDHRALASLAASARARRLPRPNCWSKAAPPSVGGYGAGDGARERVAGAAYFVRTSYAREAQARRVAPMPPFP